MHGWKFRLGQGCKVGAGPYRAAAEADQAEHGAGDGAAALPADDAPFDENLAYELRLKTLKMAQATGRTTAECPKGLESKSGTRASCTTTYEGLKVVWDVTIGKKAGWSDNVVEFDAVPDKGILTSDGVARLLYGNYRDSIDHARCNDIPKAVLVPLNVKTKYSCEVVFKGRTPGGLAEPVRATDAGPRVH